MLLDALTADSTPLHRNDDRIQCRDCGRWAYATAHGTTAPIAHSSRCVHADAQVAGCEQANKYAGTCACGRIVKASAGLAYKTARGWAVRHAECAPVGSAAPVSAEDDRLRRIAADIRRGVIGAWSEDDIAAARRAGYLTDSEAMNALAE